MINSLLMIFSIIHAIYSMKNGCPMKLGEASYIAAVRKDSIHYSNGVIIHEKHIITVAHKIADSIVGELDVVVGTIALGRRWGIRLPVKKVYLHPSFGIHNFINNFDNAFYEHDIAVLRLEQSLTWHPHVSQISLVDLKYDWAYHCECIMISWNVPRKGVLTLHYEPIILMDNRVHQQWANYLGENQKFFSDYFGESEIGWEDIGSPIVCGNFIAGLIVRDEQLKIPEKPSIVMSIAPYLEFIEDIVHDGLFEVMVEEFPYVAAIWYDEDHVCGGFIVDDTHVATVVHCVIGYEMGNFTVSVGYPPQWFSLVDLTVHSNYEFKTSNFPPGWYTEHDFLLLTLGKPILLDQKINSIPLIEPNDFHVGQHCKVLRWMHYIDQESRVESIKLMTSHVMILENEASQSQLDPNVQSQEPLFWGKSRYLIPIADYTDVGNPIICGNNPVGFLVQAIPFDGKTTAVLAKFLKIHPYIGFQE